MIRALLLVPLRDSNGQPFPAWYLFALEGRLLRLAGGFSKRTGVEGTWTDLTGRIYRDRSVEYVIGLTSWLKVRDFLEEAMEACAQFEQEAVYVEIAGHPEIIFRR